MIIRQEEIQLEIYDCCMHCKVERCKFLYMIRNFNIDIIVKNCPDYSKLKKGL